MSVKNLADAINNYEIQKKRLNPDTYVRMDVFRSFVPDWLSLGMGPPSAGGGPDKQGLLCRILMGDRPSDEELQEVFGFNNAELDAALAASDPVIKPVPDKLVLMTFDDSTIDHYTIAAPLLEQYGGHGIFFTTEMKLSMNGTSFDDKTRYMTWEQIKELGERGHEIANHSLHHDLSFATSTPEEIRTSVVGLEEKCAEHGIPKPITIGYPGGMVTPESEKQLHDMGYLWGRGSMDQCSPRIVGDCLYDPHMTTPMVVPGVMSGSKDELVKQLNNATGGKVMLRVFHEVTPGPLNLIPFEEEVAAIYDNGGRCVTFRELMEYIDPVKAWDYIYPELPPAPPVQMPPMPGEPGGPGSHGA